MVQTGAILRIETDNPNFPIIIITLFLTQAMPMSLSMIVILGMAGGDRGTCCWNSQFGLSLVLYMAKDKDWILVGRVQLRSTPITY